MLDLVFDSADLESFTMTAGDVGVEVLTYTNNRTWMSLKVNARAWSLKPSRLLVPGIANRFFDPQPRSRKVFMTLRDIVFFRSGPSHSCSSKRTRTQQRLCPTH